jgi:hypothetical protein
VTVNDGTTAAAPAPTTAPRHRHRGTGWLVLAAILLALAGLNLINNGAWALHANDVIQKTVNGQLLFSDKNLDVWGWIYLIVGAIVFVAAIAVLFRAHWAVWVGIVAGMVAVAVAFLWLFTPYWPDALVTIALAAIVVAILSKYGVEEEVAG